MSVRIAGSGWVTPLGSGISEVWDRLLRGEQAQVDTICDPLSPRSYPAYRVPGTALSGLPPHPRLRRCSAISRFAVAAGLAALNDARSTISIHDSAEIALVFAVANGGVIYTRRFYHDIVASGADAASPLLFPETVFNAAASHLAAIMEIKGASYTVVGDGAIGLFALRMAEDLLADDAIDYCLVVAAEEADWLLCDAYQKWRILRSAPPIEVFRLPARGTILSEGAGAVVLAREGPVEIQAIELAPHYQQRKSAKGKLKDVLRTIVRPDVSAAVASANGTFIDQAELESLTETLPQAVVYTPKPALGESVGASSLWQVIVAAQALRTKRFPLPQLNCPSSLTSRESFLSISDCRQIVVTSCGLSQQLAALRLAV